jgi:hypothetical protein
MEAQRNSASEKLLGGGPVKRDFPRICCLSCLCPSEVKSLQGYRTTSAGTRSFSFKTFVCGS